MKGDESIKKIEKMNWIMHYIDNSKFKYVDIFDTEFVDAYIENCNPKKIIYQPWGANSVPELGRILSEMYHSNILNRGTIGLHYHEDGFPKWCYSYGIKEYKKIE
jgi:hypothetical protein